MENSKLCRNCSTLRDICDFNKNAKSKDGLQAKCRPCEKSYKQKNKDRIAENNKLWYMKNMDKQKKSIRLWYEKNKEQSLSRSRNWYANNKDRHKEAMQRWVAENKESYMRARKEWKLKNPDRVKEINNRANKVRNRRLSFALPKWADIDAISKIYQQAKMMRDSLLMDVEVDHIVPISSSKVCGLHVENNLRIISREINSKKGNRVWPDMP